MHIRNNHTERVKVAGIWIGPGRVAEIADDRFNIWLNAREVHRYQSQQYLEVVQPETEALEPQVDTETPEVETETPEIETQAPEIETQDAPVEAETEQAEPEPDSQEDRLQKVLAAVEALNPENPDHFTKRGVPKLQPLRDYSGLPDLTVAERNLALGIEGGEGDQLEPSGEETDTS